MVTVEGEELESNKLKRETVEQKQPDKRKELLELSSPQSSPKQETKPAVEHQ